MLSDALMTTVCHTKYEIDEIMALTIWICLYMLSKWNYIHQALFVYLNLYLSLLQISFLYKVLYMK